MRSDPSPVYDKLSPCPSALGPGFRRVRPAHQEAGAWDAPYGRERRAIRKRKLLWRYETAAGTSPSITRPLTRSTTEMSYPLCRFIQKAGPVPR